VFRPADTCVMLWLCRRGAALLLPWAEHRSAPASCICRPGDTLSLPALSLSNGSKGGGLGLARGELGLAQGQARPTGRMQHQSLRAGLLSHICLEIGRRWR
jgi:hypothetical protein